MGKRIYTLLVFLLFAMVVLADGMGYGLPFFRNYTFKEYGAHNRNFDIECDDKGHVFVANFQGLLVYDGYDWHIYRSKDKCRITALRMLEGRVWFGGYNTFGYAETSGDSIRVNFISDEDDQGKILRSAVSRIYMEDGLVKFTTDDKYGSIFYLKDGKIMPTRGKKALSLTKKNIDQIIPDLHIHFVAMPDEGLKAYGKGGRLLYTLNEANGLCSNNITDIAYDGMGGLWGTTDNGIFIVNASPMYTHFGVTEGLKGQVTSILEFQNYLLVGTLQGLFIENENGFSRTSDTSLAVWQMAHAKDGSVLIASAIGIYRMVGNGKPIKLSDRHTLSLFVEEDGTFLAGTLDGLFRYTIGGNEKKLADIKYISKFEPDDKGGLWLKSLDRETFYRARRGESFRKRNNDRITLMLNYRDDRNFVWHPKENGMGLVMTGNSKVHSAWLRPFDNLEIQALLVDKGVAWLGGTFGLYRMDLTLSNVARMKKPHAYIRDLRLKDGDLSLAIATDRNAPLGENHYSYRLHDKSTWTESSKNFLSFNQIASGSYEITVRVTDAYGNVVESKTEDFYVPYPWYLWRYGDFPVMIILYIIACAGMFLLFGRWRIHRMKREKERLEHIVQKRTQALNEAHEQLLRQAKEATVGSLTKGLIDRILNPLNYINNFSHLCLELLKDVNDDMESLTPQSPSPKGEGVTADNYENQMDAIDDLHDVMGMMGQNLEKIEQHGVATTRILKAMEEMLKERGGKVEPQDVAMLCQTNVDMLHKYFAEDIQKMGIQIEWQKPEYPIVSDVVAEELSKVIMSMLGNSIYAVKKKWEKCLGKDYTPKLRVEIVPSSGTEPPILHIWDNGIGIEESIIDKIFDPFFTTKPTGEAPGVGLYLSRQIVEDVGGKITVESVKNEWTEFCIALP